jgi:TRAP-type C4-dicarboxylate transport system permease small subunit
MSAALKKLSSFNRGVSRICLRGSAAGLALMTVIIGIQVFGRYVLNDTPNWSEKFCLLLMIYYIMFAAAAGVHDKTHIGLTFLSAVLPAPVKRVTDLIVALSLGLFGCGMTWFGWQMVQSTWTHVIPTLGLSVGLSYLPFPLAGLLFILFSLEHFLALIANTDVMPSWN